MESVSKELYDTVYEACVNGNRNRHLKNNDDLYIDYKFMVSEKHLIQEAHWDYPKTKKQGKNCREI